MKSLKIFTSCENCPDNHLKAEKNRVRKAIFLLFAVLCFLSLSQIWWYEFFLLTGTRKDTNMLNGPANLRKFHRRKCDKFYLKDSYFLCRKILRNRMEICQDWYLSMHRLLNHRSCIFIWYVYFGLAKFLDTGSGYWWPCIL